MKFIFSIFFTSFLFVALVVSSSSVLAQEEVEEENGLGEDDVEIIILLDSEEEEEEDNQVDPMQDLLDQIAALQAQIQDLQSQIGQQGQMIQEQGETIEDQQSMILDLRRTLSLGMSGEDVESLQEFLAENPEIYPEGLVTGYFGPLTEAALRRWQAFYGIDPVGIAGPITRETARALRDAKRGSNLAESTDSSVEVSSLSVDTDQTISVTGVEVGVGQEKMTICHTPPGNPNNFKTLSVATPAAENFLSRGVGTLGPCESSVDEEVEEEEGEEDEEENEEEEEKEEDPSDDEEDSEDEE